MKTLHVCICFVAIYYVVGILGNSPKKTRYGTAEGKSVTSNKDAKRLAVQLLCEALEAQRLRSSEEKLDRRTANGGDLLLNPFDFDRNSIFSDVNCRNRLSSVSKEEVDDDGSSQVRRQVDSMHSCIEAKCSGSHNYLDCVLRNCISAYQLGLRRLLTTTKRGTERVFGQTERIGRGGGAEGGGGTGKREREDENSGFEAEHLVSSIPPDERGGRGEGGGGESGNVDRPVALRMLRRGFNDIADVCVQHHCGSIFPHSMTFFSCVESHCVYRR